MKKIIISLFAITILFIPLAGRGASKQPVIYIIPHQDDEMFMAGNIIRQVNNGKEVYVILITDGGASKARYMINGQDEKGHKVYSELQKKFHEPAKEGYRPLGRLDFVRVRNKEFFQSISRLGVANEKIFFANPGGIESTTTPLYKDGKLTKKQVSEIIKKYYKILGDGSYNTVAADLGHADHHAIRDALIEFPNITEKHYFAEKNANGKMIELSLMERIQKYYALHSYYVWEPKKGHFAVGAHSIRDLIDLWEKEGAEYEFDVRNLTKKLVAKES